MSDDSSSAIDLKTKPVSREVTWNWWIAIIVVVVVYFVAQYIGVELVSIYGGVFRNWTETQITNWFNNSAEAQFFYTLMAESVSFLLIWLFIRLRRSGLGVIGLLKPKITDAGYALAGLFVYFPVYIIAVDVLSYAIPSLNVSQQQQIGFSQSTTGASLILVFISLVVLPPIVEEIMFRGFLYSGLKSSLPQFWAVILTSLVFAIPHLLESNGGGLLWIAGIDTFVLSLVLIWLREKTGRLYASMGLHALKNFIAFASLFLLHTH